MENRDLKAGQAGHGNANVILPGGSSGLANQIQLHQQQKHFNSSNNPLSMMGGMMQQQQQHVGMPHQQRQMMMMPEDFPQHGASMMANRQMPALAALSNLGDPPAGQLNSSLELDDNDLSPDEDDDDLDHDMDEMDAAKQQLIDGGSSSSTSLQAPPSQHGSGSGGSGPFLRQFYENFVVNGRLLGTTPSARVLKEIREQRLEEWRRHRERRQLVILMKQNELQQDEEIQQQQQEEEQNQEEIQRQQQQRLEEIQLQEQQQQHMEEIQRQQQLPAISFGDSELESETESQLSSAAQEIMKFEEFIDEGVGAGRLIDGLEMEPEIDDMLAGAGSALGSVNSASGHSSNSSSSGSGSGGNGNGISGVILENNSHHSHHL